MKMKDTGDKARLSLIYLSKREVLLFLVIFVVLAACVTVDMTGYGAVRRWLLEKSIWDTKVICAVRAGVPDDTGRILDAFYTIWGATVAVTIFVMQISEAYQLGINLKVIAKERWGELKGRVAVAAYLTLFPAIFVCSNAGFKMSSLWCLTMAFSGLLCLIWFLQKYSKRQEILRLVNEKTLQKLAEGMPLQQTCVGCENVQAGVSIQRRSGSVHQWIDSFLITDMLEHVDYTNAYDVDILIRLIANILTDKRARPQGKMILYTWVSRIIGKIGIGTEDEKERVLDHLRLLWEQIMEKESDPAMRQAYSVHLMFPLFDVQRQPATELMIRLWRRFTENKRSSLVYLLLYTEYRYWFDGGTVHNWMVQTDCNLQLELDMTRRGEVRWDEQTAQEYWLDWWWYHGEKSDIGLKQFYDFSRGMKSLGDDSQVRVCTPVMLKL